MNIRNINEMPWYFRLAIFGGVALAIYGGFWYFMTKGMHEEVEALKQDVASLKQQNMSTQIDSQRLANFKALYESKQQEYEDLKALLPEQKELTNVLQGIQDRARGTRLVLSSFSPKDDMAQDFYTGKRISVGVTSSFASLRDFFEQMARYQRIVSITNFEISQLDKQSPGKTVTAKFDLTAYYLTPEAAKNAAPAAPGQPAAPAAPAANAPTGASPTAPPQIKIPSGHTD